MSGSTDIPYPAILCPLCGSTFINPNEVRMHMNLEHPIPPVEDNPAIRNNPFLRSVVDVGKQIIADPLGNRERMRLMAEASIESARRVPTAGDVNDQLASILKGLQEQYKEVCLDVEAKEQQLDLRLDARARLEEAIRTLEDFLYPAQTDNYALAGDATEARMSR